MKTKYGVKSIKLEDIGVLLIGFNRPELLRKRLVELSSSPLRNIYISIDGGDYLSNSEIIGLRNEAQKIYGRRLKEFKHYKKNLGMTKHIAKSITLVLRKHPYIIVIEDDVVLSKNFIRNMTDGLKFISKLNLNGIVSGNSHYYSNLVGNKWRVVKFPSIWGWACSRETWRGYSSDIGSVPIEKELDKSQIWQTLSSTTKNIMLKKFRRSQKQPGYTWDIQFIFHLLKNDYLSLAPIFSISGNEGFEDLRASHTIYKPPKNIKNFNLNEKIISSMSNYSNIYEFIDIRSIKYKIKLYLKFRK